MLWEPAQAAPGWRPSSWSLDMIPALQPQAFCLIIYTLNHKLIFKIMYCFLGKLGVNFMKVIKSKKIQIDQDSSKCFKEALTLSVMESEGTAVTWFESYSVIYRHGKH